MGAGFVCDCLECNKKFHVSQGGGLFFYNGAVASAVRQYLCPVMHLEKMKRKERSLT
jgi:hypothetical protein